MKKKKKKMRETRKRIFEQCKGFEKHEKEKVKMRKTSKRIFEESKGTEKHKKKKEQMRKTSKRFRAIQNRVESFKNLVQEGPFYICVCCNRCLYKRSVVLFKIEEYTIDTDCTCDIIPSYDDNCCTCLTCHKKILKKEIPCQSVSNKLQLFEFPNPLNYIVKLERILVSQRILFRKVAIMPKEQFPKLKGATCNIPVETGNICNILPRGADSSGVVYVQLKRKLSHKFPVISEPSASR